MLRASFAPLVVPLASIAGMAGICPHCLILFIYFRGIEMERQVGTELAARYLTDLMRELLRMNRKALREWWKTEEEADQTRREGNH